MFTGDIFITDDESVALSSAMNPQYKVLAIEPNIEDIFGYGSGVLPMGYLLPPYAALEQEEAGNLPAFYEMYYSHLMSDDVDSYIAIILAGMYKGFNILLYASKDSMQNTQAISALLNYLQNYFGLTVGTVTHPSAFNVQFEDMLRLKMFKHGYIDAIDICKNIKGQVLDVALASLMCQELKINTTDPVTTINSYIVHYKAKAAAPVIAAPTPVPFDIREGF